VTIEDQQSASDRKGTPSNPGRRRFAGAGVILTLASEPGMAAVMCKSPSGSLSGSLQSSPGSQTVVCGGLSPGYWKTHPEDWPPGYYPSTSGKRKANTFASVFPFGSTTLYKTGTLMEVLENGDPSQDPYNLGFHLVAAYFNVLTNKINYVTVERLKGMWHDLVTYGYYSPAAGVKWYAESVKNYLQSTEH